MWSIKTKLILSIILLVSTVQIGTAFFILQRMETTLLQENHKRAFIIANSLANNCMSSLLARDMAGLHNYINTAMGHTFVRKAAFITPDRRILMHNNIARIGKIYTGLHITDNLELSTFSDHYEIEGGEEIMDVLVPVRVGGDYLGTAIVGYSRKGIKEEIRDVQKHIVIYLAMGILGAILFAFPVGTYIVRPIKELQRDAEALANEQYDIDDPGSTQNDEIGELRQAFYTMADKLKRRVCYDPLTGTYSRQFFQIRLKELCSRVDRYHIAMAVLMLDMDHFKQVNDTYGHLMGDEVLMEIGNLLRREIRNEDCVARYGGEEFVILLPSTAETKALQIAERIRSRVASHPFRMSNGQSINLTISVGLVCGSPGTVENMDTMLDYADQALYLAKVGGRNRVAGPICLAEGDI